MEKGQKDRSLEAGLRRTEDRWIEAYLDGDVEGFANLLTDDFVYASERVVFNKRSYVQNLASGVIEMRGLRNSDREVRLHGSTGISTGAATPNATAGGVETSAGWTESPAGGPDTGSGAAVLHANNIPKEA